MKNKPTRHKESNTFRFQSFSERIGNLKVDVFHHVQAFDTEAEDSETHLQNAIDKWNVQNGTEAFEKCLRSLPDCRSLAQILLNQEKIFKILCEHINHKDALALQGLLELLVALARDTRHEFYPNFAESLTLIFGVISTSRDPDVLEWGFQAMAYLLKFLWRSLLKEPASLIFDHVLPMLEDSRPVYIQEFASQCFAFVARKVRDKEGLVKAMIDKVERENDGIEGTGIMVSETLYGVSGSFHSNAGQFLGLLFSFLNRKDVNAEVLKKILSHAVKRLIFKVKIDNFDPFWKTATVALETLRCESCHEGLTHMFEILQVVSETKGGFYLQPAPIISTLKDLISKKEVPNETFQAASNLVARMLSAQSLKLSQEHTASLVTQVLSIDNKDLFLNFVGKVASCGGFETYVLPSLTKFCTKSSSEDFPKILLVLAEIIGIKSPVCHSGLELQNWKQYPLSVQKSPLADFILAQLDGNDHSKIIQALVVLPHLYCIDRKVTKQKLFKLIARCSKDSNIFLMGLAVETAVHLLLTNELDKDLILQMVLEHKEELAALRMFDLYVTDRKIKDVGMFEKLLEANYYKILSSPYHKNRVIASHTLSVLEPEENKLFALCLQAENTPATITDYRDRIKGLNALEFKHVQGQSDYSTEAALQFLIGNLYVNFKLMWDPVTSLIVSHANGQDTNKFWPLLIEQLKLAHDRCTREAGGNKIPSGCDQFITEFRENLENQLDSPDHVHFRSLLWNSMTFFPDICEAKNRDISILFLNFLETEFFNKDVGDSNFWNVTKDKNDEENKSEAMETDEVDEPADEDDEDAKEDLETDLKSLSKSKARPVMKLLLAHLDLLAKLRNPRGMYREPELREAYHELLKLRNAKAQKLSLDCIMAYKYPYLVPYKDQLYGLVGDKEFKNMLVAFNVGTESDVVLAEHRPDLIPVVMRIVLSKMQSKTKMKGGSKRSLILRFLGGCQQQELLVFIGLAFKNILSCCKEGEDFQTLVARIIQDVDLNRVVPPKRLTSAVNLANVVLSQLGRNDGGMSLCTQVLIKVQLAVAAQVTGVMRKKEQVKKSAILAFRSTRKTVIEGFTKLFFKDYQGDSSTLYQWTAVELDAIFDAIVWPSLDVLHIECAVNPTALLKMFAVWAGNTRYFNLLVKHKEGDEGIYPLSAMVKLLKTDTTKGRVTGVILDALINLLTLRPATDEEEEEIDVGTSACELTDITNIVSIDEEYLTKIQTPGLQLNYGSKLILPHLADILGYLHRRVALANNKMKAKGGLSEKDLVVLARVSELVFDPVLSLSLLRLVLPLAVRKANLSAGEKTLEPLLTTVSFLLRRIENPKQFCLQIAPLFGSVLGRGSRDKLCQIVYSRVINIINEDEAKVICDLNSWDCRHIDEPDFEKRINGFSNIKTMDDSSVEFFLMVIHSCFHTLKAEKDLSLRDCASLCLQTVCPKLAKKYADDPETRTLVMERTSMEIIRKGIRDKNESVQEEIIGLLGVMVRECGHLHPTLRDLAPLACPDDMEIDFFENIRHLQIHRRSRALTRFSTVVKESGITMKNTTLTKYILPLATSYLCVEKYAKVNSLIDAVIEAVATACSMLPWAEYEIVLRFHLARLPRMFDYQKQLVRTVIAVLDAYHFDLSILESNPLEPVKAVVTETSENDVTEIAVDDEEDLVEKLENAEEKEIVKCGIKEATKIRNTILHQLLPKLQQTISAKLATDSIHKVNKNSSNFAEDREREAREVLRVPIALAIIKLLQKLPGNPLAQYLTGVLLKICIFLRSKLESTRRAARETMLQILRVIGTKYLHKMLTELCALLTRGYLVHVLIYTVHSLIVGVRDIIQPGDIDPCLQNILQVCTSDLFGDAAEEKEIAQIAGKTSEARSHKSFDTLHLIAKYVSEKSVTDILLPIKTVLASSHSYKIVKKSNSCMQQIVQGLAENKFISDESLLLFAYGTASESIPALKSATRANNKPKEKLTDAQKAIQRPDTFLIQAAPKRCGPVSTKTVDTHAHAFIAFGLQLLHFLLKRERTKEIPDEMLDPFVIILAESLNSQHNRLSILSLQCLAWLLRVELPSMKENVTCIADNIFKILHKFSGSGQGKGDNFDMANSAFKAIGVLVREVEYHNISKEQLRLLLLYAERDIQADSSRQATAFTLLKAILRRRMNSPDLQQVIQTVAELSITSPMIHVRQQARQVFLFYMSEYQTGKHYENQLTFLLSQFNFELQTGRMSALETLSTLVHTMPSDRLALLASLIFIPTSAALVNDEDPECRQIAAKVLKSLIQRLDPKGREQLFIIAEAWFKDEKISHKRLAAQVCGLFVTLDGENFNRRLPKVLPLVYKCFNPVSKCGRFVRAPRRDDKMDEDGEVCSGGSINDHLLFQTLQLLIKISQSCSGWLKNPALEGTVDDICQEVLPLLGHSHEWVRLGACQFIGCIFAAVEPADVAEAIAQSAEESPGLLIFKTNPELVIKTLMLDLCDLLQPGEMQAQLVEQIVKNLVYLARVLKHIPSTYAITLNDDEDSEKIEDEAESKTKKPKLSLVWIARRMRRIVNLEITKAPKSGTLRTAVLKWTTAVIIDLGPEAFTKNPVLVHHMLAPVVREISINNENNPHAPVGLRRFAKEAANMIKEQIGVEAFALASSKLTAKFNEHRAYRKRKIAQQVITEPEVAARRKIKKQVAKKEAKKTKINNIKGRVRKNYRVERDNSLDF